MGIGYDVIVSTRSEARPLRERRDAFSRAVFEEGVSLALRSARP